MQLNNIPFVEFTKGLVVDVFDALVESHITQMQEYANFVNTVSTGLTEYINNTIDNVSFTDVSNLITTYNLPTSPTFDIGKVLDKLQQPSSSEKPQIETTGNNTPTQSATVWDTLIRTLGPVISNLVDKVRDSNKISSLKAVQDYNNEVTSFGEAIADKVPTYSQIHDSIAAVIASNKYALLQNIVNQGTMQLKVERGEIETRLNFNTWTYDTQSQFSSNSINDKQKSASNNFTGSGILGLLTGKKSFNRNLERVTTVNVNTASSQSSSGTNINVFGGVKLYFRTAP